MQLQIERRRRGHPALDDGAVGRGFLFPSRYDFGPVTTAAELIGLQLHEFVRSVSAVIYNRLDADMPLAIDATLRYGLRVPGNRPLTKSDLASRTPYNTRRFNGLPPTPIGNPGLASIQAAAHPAKVDYLYYVRTPDKLHHFFTADADEFCRKAREYGYGC